jgi:predicted acyl esterase
LHLPGAFSAYQSINAPKKLMITVPESGVGFNRPWHENHDIILRWYDHWLKGNDTGIMGEAPIRILVQGANQWRYEKEWPLARTRWTKLYLGVRGSLKQELAGWNERPDKVTTAIGLLPGEKIPSLRYSTEPLTSDMELTGPMALYLYAAISTTDTSWFIEIYDVDPMGTEKRVSVGWLKASHYELDESKSKPYQPFHSHKRAISIEPGKVVEYAIDIRETSYVFRAGHRMQLIVKTQDASWEGSGYRAISHIPPSIETRHTIYHTPEYPSHLLLPVIPGG